MTVSHSEPKHKGMKVLVCQRGARHRYAVPRMLEEQGLLAALYTDSTAYSPLGQLASGLGRLGLRYSRMEALRSRIPTGIPPGRIFSSDRPLYVARLGNLVSQSLRGTFVRWGLQGAGVVYSMYGEDYGFLEWAKSKGARIMVDVFIHPRNHWIVRDEELRCFSQSKESPEVNEAYDLHSRRAFKLADLLLCPSEWVAEGVQNFAPEYAHKVRLVPYGSSLEASASINGNSRPGRILFVGRDPLRKGLHYLAEAAHRVRSQGFNIEVRAAGIEQKDVEWMEHQNDIHCLGKLPLDAVREEYEQADVLVFPSLSEGQAGVILEAMACGCPVIATRESGVDFEAGCGISVPARNAEALADAIVGIVRDRQNRNKLAQGALRQSAMFSMEAWQQRLVRAIEDVAVV